MGMFVHMNIVGARVDHRVWRAMQRVQRAKEMRKESVKRLEGKEAKAVEKKGD